MIVPHHRRGRRRLGARIALIVSLIVVFSGWSLYYSRTRSAARSAAAPSPAKGPAAASQVQSYTVRGRIEELPDPDHPSSTLQIHHEEIENFARKDGTLGMSAMTMSFPHSSAVTFDGLAVGDAVEFTLEVNWGGAPLYQITRISKLPAETVLDFDAASALIK